MTLKYFQATDSLVIRLCDAIVVHAEEIGPNIIADYDGNGRVIGLESHRASEQVELDEVVAATIPCIAALLASN